MFKNKRKNIKSKSDEVISKNKNKVNLLEQTKIKKYDKLNRIEKCKRL